jgi:hypothetical protein
MARTTIHEVVGIFATRSNGGAFIYNEKRIKILDRKCKSQEG